MKKIFDNPAINISVFSKENIVTESATNSDAAEAALNTAGVTKPTTVKFSDLKVTW